MFTFLRNGQFAFQKKSQCRFIHHYVSVGERPSCHCSVITSLHKDTGVPPSPVSPDLNPGNRGCSRSLMAAWKYPQGFLYPPSRQVDSHAWHQLASAGCGQRPFVSRCSWVYSPMGLLAAVPPAPPGVLFYIPTAR